MSVKFHIMAECLLKNDLIPYKSQEIKLLVHWLLNGKIENIQQNNPKKTFICSKSTI